MSTNAISLSGATLSPHAGAAVHDQVRAEIHAALPADKDFTAVFSGDSENPAVVLHKKVLHTISYASHKIAVEQEFGLKTKPTRLASIEKPALWVLAQTKNLNAEAARWRVHAVRVGESLLRLRAEASEISDEIVEPLDRYVLKNLTFGPLKLIEKSLPRLASDLDRRLRAHQESVHLAEALAGENLTSYKDLFSVARALGSRKLTLFAGPTNSGKTFRGLNELVRHKTGVYLAPLRLLALEGQEEIARRGRVASFLTGEEREILPGADFVASTIEMLDLHQPVDCALIDEVQNLSDPQRGWAWTQAIIGAPAREVLMTGNLSSIPMVEKLAQYLGEDLEVVTLDRLNPLLALDAPVPLEEAGKPGTAIIAFTRRDVLGLREVFEQKSIPTSVIYGALSPEVRRNEARRFREGETGVLIATDAIGMGLNLKPIQRVLFYTLRKFNGKEETLLSLGQFHQIAGRAGRYGLAQAGYVGALSEHDAERVRRMIEQEPEPGVSTFLVKPSIEHLEAILALYPDSTMRRLLQIFVNRMRFDRNELRTAVTDEMFMLAAKVDSVQERHARKGLPPLTLEEAFTFICAPVDLRSDEVYNEFSAAVDSFAERRRHGCPWISINRNDISHSALERLETGVKVLTLYCWLAYRFPACFVDLAKAAQFRAEANHQIGRCLRARNLKRVCSRCKNPLPPLSPYSKCDRCYSMGYDQYR